LVQAQEDERSRIAADVHDDSVQALAAVDLRLGLLRTRLARRDPELAADLAPELDKVVSTVSGATTRLRNLLFDLESPARRTTLAVSLGEAADFVFGGTDVAWTVEGDTAIDLPEHHRVTAYRIAKEAMVNARKHADADAVTITITRTDEHVVVSVRDDGRGIDPALVRDRPGHLGIGAMRDRASIAGGVLEVSAHPEGGTEVRLTLRA
jgi:signal transduction histidine kinase